MARPKLPENLAINNVMDVEEASELWGISKQRLKVICAEGGVIARKVGRIWIIEKDQKNPRKYASTRTAGTYEEDEDNE